MRAHLGLALAVAFALPAYARTKIRLKNSREIRFTYNSPSWNMNPGKIDSAFLIFRDAITNRMAQIQLEETEPDSSTFVGEFSITWADSSNNISPEIYIPPPELRKKDQKALFQIIQSGKLPRKPLIVKKDEANGGKIVVIFDTREQAETAWQEYQKELKANQQKLIKPVPSEQSIAAAEMAKYKKEMEDLAKQAGDRETVRGRMEREEREKLNAAQANFVKLSAEEQSKRQADGERIWNDAMASYKSGDFVKAETLFRQSIDTDPLSTSYYYNYGVSQYRNDKMNEAMVSMRIAPDDSKTALEKKYYMGLIHLKLKELEAAGKLFDEVSAAKDPVLSPSALYYKGVLLFSDGKYEEAKKPFEDVIDTSQDPKLDAQADDYLDKIANAISYQKMAEQRWNLNATIGLLYDSNVLLSPDNQASQGSTSNKGDARLMTVAQLNYRAIFNPKYEFIPNATVNMTNSSNPNVSTADSWIYTVEAPLTYKGVLWDKGYRFTARPGFEMLYMALEADQPKRDILNSPYIALDNTFVMRDNWFATYTLQFRHDVSNLHIGDPGYVTSNDNSTANQWYLKTSQTFLLNGSKKEALIANAGYMRNEAEGMNKTYDRFEVGATYLRPIGSYSWNVGLNFYYLNFPIADENDHRTDENYSISTGVAKPVNDWFTWGVTGSYTDNPSTQTSTYQYQKFIIMTTATFNTGW